MLTLGRGWGGLATYVAACLARAMTFFAIRLIGGNALRQVENRAAIRLLDRLDARPTSSVVLHRVLFQTIPALNDALARVANTSKTAVSIGPQPLQFH